MTKEERKKADDWCKRHQDPIFNENESLSNLVRMALEEFIRNHP